MTEFRLRSLPSRQDLLNAFPRSASEDEVTGLDMVIRLAAAGQFVRQGCFEPYFRERQVSEGKFLLLVILYAEGDTGTTTLAKRLGVSAATVSVMVKRMLAAPEPLIAQSVSPEDGRGRRLELTPAGTLLIRSLIDEHLHVIHRVASVYTLEEKKELMRLLGKLIASGDAIQKSLREDLRRARSGQNAQGPHAKTPEDL